MIRTVFIDIDDTLLSFSGYVREAMRTGFAHFDLPAYTDEMFSVFEEVNHGLWRQIEQGTLDFEELQRIRWNRIFAALEMDFDGPTFETYFRERLFDSAVLEPNVRPMLRYLESRYILCAASNGPYEQQLNRLRVGGIYDHFRHFFISSKIGIQKPEKGFFDACFEELRAGSCPDLAPEEAMIIGDSETSDISGGADYGMHTCLYLKKPSQAPVSTRAEYVIEDLLDIRSIL